MGCNSDSTSHSIRVMLVGDSPVLRSGFRQLLEGAGIAVVASVASALEAMSPMRSMPVDAVLIGAVTRHGDAGDTREILSCHPGVEILVLCRSGTVSAAQASVDAGARCYLVLDDAVEGDLVEAVRAVAAGETYPSPFMPPLSTVALPWRTRDGALDRLTGRERQVLTLVAGGRSNREVAAMLGLSTNTVAAHRANLMKTLAVRKTAALVLFAVRCGLVSPDGVDTDVP